MGGGGRNGVREMGRDGEMGWRVGVIHPSQEEKEKKERKKKGEKKRRGQTSHQGIDVLRHVFSRVIKMK